MTRSMRMVALVAAALAVAAGALLVAGASMGYAAADACIPLTLPSPAGGEGTETAGAGEGTETAGAGEGTETAGGTSAKASTEAQAGTPAEAQAEGIAARYPGDRGIAADPRVLLHEDFEAGDFDRKKWQDISNQSGALSFSPEHPAASAGKQSLLVTATLGKNTGGHLFRRFKPGVERMHARFYVRFAEDCDYVHHFVHIVAENPPVAWPTGGAGECPAGDRKFSTGLEPAGHYRKFPPPGAWNFYTYWHQMKRSGDGKYWGNSFAPETPHVPERGRWYAMEMMVQANTVGKADGRQAFWIDGVKVGDFGGIEWRTAADLKINAFWLMSYITDRWTKHPVNRVWFDDVVVATEYIGPIRPSQK